MASPGWAHDDYSDPRRCGNRWLALSRDSQAAWDHRRGVSPASLARVANRIRGPLRWHEPSVQAHGSNTFAARAHEHRCTHKVHNPWSAPTNEPLGPRQGFDAF